MTKKQEYQARINSRLITPENKMEGTLGQDVIAPVAYELARFEELELNTMLDRAFARTAQGEDLDRVGEDEELPRKPAQSSIIKVKVSGVDNAVVSKGVQIVYSDLVFTAIETKTIVTGFVDVEFECDTQGIVGNLPSGVIFEFVGSPYGLTNAVSLDLLLEGVDKEEDEPYRERILEKKRNTASSGNVDDYIGWAKSVVGVDDVLVVPLESGNGTVSVYISTADNTTPTQELIKEVTDYINDNNPIGADCTVKSVDYVNIDIVANIKLAQGGSKSSVLDEFTQLLMKYLKETTATRVVSYLKMSDLLFSCSGVADVLSYTLNGGDTSIALSDLQIAREGAITINA